MLVIVDLSNLCRDGRFLASGVRADLGLLDRFAAGVRASGIETREIHSVADRSLIHHLPPEQRRAFRELHQEGRVELSHVADERILELAFRGGADGRTLVASLDHFDDFRRIYPLIQGSSDRFLTWRPGPSDELLVHWRTMGDHGHHRLSRKEEIAQLKARRLDRTTLVCRALRTYFRCTNGACLLGQLWPDRLPDLPRYDDDHDSFVCPSCREPLVAGDLRSSGLQLIVFLHGAEQFRVLLEDGKRLLVGRREAAGCLGLQTRLPEGSVEAISRKHLALTLGGGRLTVEDLGSRNGSVYRVPGEPEEPLLPGRIRTLGRRGSVALPGGVTIERSGRSIALDDERVDEAIEPEEELPATRLLARP